MARQMDNVSLLFSLPFDKRSVRGGNGGDEDCRGVNLPNNEVVRISLNAMEHAISKFDIGRPLNKHFRVHKSPHAHSPRSVSPERFDKRGQLAALIKPVTNMVSA